MSELGRDIAMKGRGLAYGRVAEGLELLLDHIIRRLSTRPGSVPGAEEEGMDLLDLLQADVDQLTLSALPGRIRAQLLRDPRILDVAVVVNAPGTVHSTLSVTIIGEAAQGSFRLVLAAGEVDLKVLARGGL